MNGSIENKCITAKGLCASFDSLHEAKFLNLLSLPCEKVDDTCVISLCELVHANESLNGADNISPTEFHSLSLKGLEILRENLICNI